MEQKQNETRQWSKSKTRQKALEEMVYEGNHLPHQDKFEASFDRMLNPPGELIQAIPLSLIQPFPDHPFRVEEGEELEQLKQSIRENGVMSPAIVRPLPGGGFQMISGHRRMAACKALELERMPAIAREMDDDIATAMMVEANLQREKILPSEKAFAYKMRAEALQRLNTPADRNIGGGDANRITARIGAQTGESYKTVQRFIRLTELIPSLLELVDRDRLGPVAAVELSYLPKNEQQYVLTAIESEQSIPSPAQAKELRRLSSAGELTEEAALTVFLDRKGKTPEKLAIPMDKLSRFFPKDATPRRMEQEILGLLEQRERKRRRDRQMER